MPCTDTAARWAWVSSKPSRTTVPLPQAGQWTPSGQRCWRTRAKHLASSISAERLTRAATVILEGPHAGWPARAVFADYHRGPAGTLPRPPPTTPEPNKSHPKYQPGGKSASPYNAHPTRLALATLSARQHACPVVPRARWRSAGALATDRLRGDGKKAADRTLALCRDRGDPGCDLPEMHL